MLSVKVLRLNYIVYSLFFKTLFHVKLNLNFTFTITVNFEGNLLIVTKQLSIMKFNLFNISLLFKKKTKQTG